MKKYLFISNSNKPSEEKENSREDIELGNVRKPCLDAANQLGYDLWLGVNRKNPNELSVKADYQVHLYDSHTYRSITNFKDNYIAYKNTMDVLKKGEFEVIHCNTPIGGVIGRICGKKAKVKTVIYTAHGFHFYKGAPLFNRTVLKWVEKMMARWTDVIITMNKEDYEAAQKFKLRNNGKVYFVPGVGIDTSLYENVEVNHMELRKSLNLRMEDFVCISMGDLIERKNYETAIEAIAKCNNKNVHYLICGRGPKLKDLIDLSKKLNIENQIHFLGFRTDIKELLQIADLFLFTTKQEGLPRSMMEAMASGLPCIASKIRGNVDLLEDEKGGYLVPVTDVDLISNKINLLCNSEELRKKFSDNNLKRIKEFDISKIKKIILDIYINTLKQ